MKTRKILLLAAIAVLACVYAAQLVFSRSGSVKELKLADEPDSISIVGPGGEALTLAKEGRRWLIGEKKYPADQAKVEAMLKALSNIKILETVSASGDSDRYGLEEASRLVITVSKGGKVLRTICAGKASSASNQSYAYVDGEKDVLLVAGKLRSEFDKTAESLRDRTIWNVKGESVTRVDSDFSRSPRDIAGSGTRRIPFLIEKAGEGVTWKEVAVHGASGELDTTKVSAWVDSIASIRADSFAPEVTPTPAQNLGTITLTASGKAMTLSIVRKEGDTKYLCASSESPYLFYLQAGTVARLAKAPREF